MKTILTTMRLAIIGLLLLPLAALAQQYLGFANSNYAGVHGMLLQPASIVDMRYKVDINLISLDATVRNNYTAFRMDRIKSGIDSDRDFQDYYMSIPGANPRTDDKRYYIYSNLDILGPAFAFRINKKNSLGFFTRSRTMFNFDNISPQLARLAWEGLDYEDLWQTDLQNGEFSMQMMSWAEYGFTYGREILSIGDHYLKGGVSVKFLQGLGSAFIYANQLEYNFTNDDTLSLFETEVEYGHSDNFEFDEEAAGFNFVGKPSVGVDLGFVYEWRKDRSEYTYDMDGETGLLRRDLNKYKLKIGFAINDMGSIRYSKGGLSGNFLADIDNYDISDFNVESVSDFNDTINKNFTYTETAGNTYKMRLPTHMVLQVDYNLWKGFYVNFTGVAGLRRDGKPSKNRYQTTYSITPRFEHRWFDFGIPVSFAQKELGVGASFRFAFLVIGTDNFLPAFADKVYGADFYLGIKIPIPYGKPKDRDKDGVSNRKDNCKDKPGTWATMGCPDTDGDGLLDSEDECPEQAGPLENGGCPWADRDNDGVFDKDDECIDVAGPAENNGCPWADKDGDGVLDNVDECIDVAGPVENNGCPWADKDGDGVLDNEDDCIDTPGPIENNGCPYGDKDGDGVLDMDDDCIDVAGPAENKGCPWPDSDGDGVLDKDDECPRTPGPPENNGCPIIEEKEQEVIDMAFDNLEFETGKTIIKSKSFQYLYNLADLLDKNEAYKLRIAGHTDNVGSDQTNLALSKRRAEAVAKVFTDRGIKADRLIIEYYGESQPIATNDTPEGRTQNRRVEMEVVFD